MAYPRRRPWSTQDLDAAKALLASWFHDRRFRVVTQEDLSALIGHPIDLAGLAPAWNISIFGQALEALVTEGKVTASQGPEGDWTYTPAPKG